MNVLNNLSLKKKFSLVLIFISIPLIFLSIMAYSNATKRRMGLENEMTGLSYIEALSPVAKLINEYEFYQIQALYIEELGLPAPDLPSLQQALQRHLSEVKALNARVGSQLSTNIKLESLNKAWDRLTRDTGGKDTLSIIAKHDEINTAIRDLANAVVDHSGLELDSYLNSSMLVENLTLHLPRVLVSINDLSKKLLIMKALDMNKEADIAHLKEALAKLNGYIKAMLSDYELVFQIDSDIERALELDIETFFEKEQDWIRYVQTTAIYDGVRAMDVNVMLEKKYALFDQWHLIEKKTLENLDILFKNRQRRYWQQDIFELVCLVVFVSFALFSFHWAVKSVLLPLQKAKRVFDEISRGQYNTKINVSSRDEHGRLLLELEKMRATIFRQLQQLEDYRGRIEAIDTNQMVIEYDINGYLISANKNYLALTGKNLDEIKGGHFAEFVHSLNPKDKAQVVDWQALLCGEHLLVDYQRKTNSAKCGTFWFKSSFDPIFNLQGKVVKVVEYAENVTDQRRLKTSVDDLIDEVSKLFAGLAKGNLCGSLEREYQGGFNALQKNCNRSMGQLNEALVQVRTAIADIASTSSQISQGNGVLRKHAQKQAQSLDKAVQTMEHIMPAVGENAQSARQAAQVVEGTRHIAEKGGNIVGQAIQAMNEINDSSTRIANIISVINDIAFQTNLLALNASVEAARAGEQGRGFAVVAGEVRNLAGRSATAAKQIRELIEDSREKVSEGSLMVNQSGAALREIVSSVKEVSDIVANIAKASEDQALEISDVSRSLVQINEGTNSSAALVLKIDQASQQLVRQSDGLSQRISFFQTTQDQEKLS